MMSILFDKKYLSFKKVELSYKDYFEIELCDGIKSAWSGWMMTFIFMTHKSLNIPNGFRDRIKIKIKPDAAFYINKTI